MKILALFLILGLGVSACDMLKSKTTTTESVAGVFGKADFKGVTTTLQKAMDEFVAGEEKTLLVQGEVKKVCEKKGCWLELADESASVRTTMKDYGFVVPKEIKGKTVFIQGHLVQKDLPKSAIKHYMKDEGKSEKEIETALEKIPGETQRVFQFVADGVRMS